LIANHDRTSPPAEAVAALERTGDRARLAVGFDEGGTPVMLPTEPGICGFEARLLAAIVEARIQGSWDRLKACGCSTCLWVFYDESKNRSRSWCSMEVCGNREKARRYRARARA
jgi:predicted RNA-binding Zn ribbon-like protein